MRHPPRFPRPLACGLPVALALGLLQAPPALAAAPATGGGVPTLPFALAAVAAAALVFVLRRRGGGR